MGTARQRRALLLVALAAVLANASWFSATAVGPALEHDWHLTSAGAAWLVIMVQVGFVTGSVGAALLNLPDRIEPRWLIAGSALAAGATRGMGRGLGLGFRRGAAYILVPGRRLPEDQRFRGAWPGPRRPSTVCGRQRRSAGGILRRVRLAGAGRSQVRSPPRMPSLKLPGVRETGDPNGHISSRPLVVR